MPYRNSTLTRLLQTSLSGESDLSRCDQTLTGRIEQNTYDVQPFALAGPSQRDVVQLAIRYEGEQYGGWQGSEEYQVREGGWIVSGRWTMVCLIKTDEGSLVIDGMYSVPRVCLSLAGMICLCYVE